MTVLGFEPRFPRHRECFVVVDSDLTGRIGASSVSTILAMSRLPNVPQRDVLTTALYQRGTWIWLTVVKPSGSLIFILPADPEGRESPFNIVILCVPRVPVYSDNLYERPHPPSPHCRVLARCSAVKIHSKIPAQVKSQIS